MDENSNFTRGMIFDCERHKTAAVFSTDDLANKRRAECDYSLRYTFDEAKRGIQKRPLRVYTEGVFDMFHHGHARMLQQAKNCFPGPVYLIVGICNEAECIRNKRMPVNTVEERLQAVCNNRYVDEVVSECPWETTPDYFEKHKLDFFCHDALPYTCDDTEDLYAWIKKAGYFFPTERTPNISTTDLITRLLNRKDLHPKCNNS